MRPRRKRPRVATVAVTSTPQGQSVARALPPREELVWQWRGWFYHPKTNTYHEVKG